MTVELDHLFIWTFHGAPEAERLIAFGLTEGAPNHHSGQGTANRRFFFQNAMLELLWIENAAEAQSEGIGRVQLWERWLARGNRASPFGIGLRPTDPKRADAPFPAWEYRPPYLPDPLVIHIGADTPLSEPIWFYLAFARRPDSGPVEKRPPLDHPIGFREMTGVRLTRPAAQPLSAVGEADMRAGVISILPGKEHLIEVIFDGHRKGRHADFRPDLPLIFRW